MSDTGDQKPAQGGEGQPVETFAFNIGGKEIKLPKVIDGINLQEGLGQVIGRSRSEAKKEFEKTASELRELLQKKDITIEEFGQKLQQIEDEKLTTEERIKKETSREVEKLRKELEKVSGESKSHLDKYKNTRIENEILSAISKHQVVNASQLSILLRAAGAADLAAEENGVDKVILKMKINGEEQVLSPADAVEKFLAMPENMHHLKNNLRSGGGSTAGGNKRPDGTISYTRDQLRDPAVRKEAYEKMARGEKVDLPLDD